MGKSYALHINGHLYSRSSSVMAFRGQCGFVTGFPSNSASTVSLCSQLLNDGKKEVFYKGEKTLIELVVTDEDK